MIKLAHIHKSYQTGIPDSHILIDIGLQVCQGEFTAIMGASGSGKTTLMNIIGCLDRPTEGSYHLDGIDVMSLQEKELAHIRNQKIGFVFQNFHLLPRLTAAQNVELVLIYGGVGKKERRQRSSEILEKMELSHRAHYFPNQLSGGQRQRVAIARALVTEPDIILADEPTGALDSVTGQHIMNLFTRLHNEGKTVIIVTHESAVAACTNRIVRIHDGRIV